MSLFFFTWFLFWRSLLTANKTCVILLSCISKRQIVLYSVNQFKHARLPNSKANPIAICCSINIWIWGRALMTLKWLVTFFIYVLITIYQNCLNFNFFFLFRLVFYLWGIDFISFIIIFTSFGLPWFEPS